MKGDVLSCLCTFLSPKLKFSLYKKITKQRDNNNQEQVKEKHGKVACRQKTLLQCVAGKYLWSCHGTRSQLSILFKQSLSEHAEGDEDTVSLWFPCGPLSQHHTLQTPRPLWERKATKNRVRAHALTEPAGELFGPLAPEPTGNGTPERIEGFPRMSELFSGKDREWRLASANKKGTLWAWRLRTENRFAHSCHQHFQVRVTYPAKTKRTRLKTVIWGEATLCQLFRPTWHGQRLN